MSASRPGQAFPRGPLLGAAGLVALTILASAVARIGGVGTQAPPAGTAVEARDLRFEDRPDGGVAIYDDDRMVAAVTPGTNGFLRATMRGLARERKRSGIGAEPPFRLTRWDDGRLSLDDPATGRRVELVAFGPTNAQVFAELLTAKAAPQ